MLVVRSRPLRSALCLLLLCAFLGVTSPARVGQANPTFPYLDLGCTDGSSQGVIDVSDLNALRIVGTRRMTTSPH